MIHQAGQGHIGGDYSCVDILVALYFAVMDFDPAAPSNPERDRLVLSKGHAAGALYTTFAALGLLRDADLDTFMRPESRLNGHPAVTKVTGVEASTGPLGHGLPVAVGMALAAKLDGSPRRTFVVTGDGELEEGSNWEAMMVAAHHGCANLTLVVDRNGLQQGATTRDTTALAPLQAKIAAFGFEVVNVDGHCYPELIPALAAVGERPRCVLAHTVKGYPISFMVNQVGWHHRVPSADEVARILAELAEPDEGEES
ncbi:MAG: transketolase [Actinomycetia bacterium]|nr:transketolase [Actinomycetes bacterium]